MYNAPKSLQITDYKQRQRACRLNIVTMFDNGLLDCCHGITHLVCCIQAEQRDAFNLFSARV